MFRVLHYTAKVLLGLALAGVLVLAYASRHWFHPALEWIRVTRRAQTDPLPVVARSTGVVVRVTSGNELVLRTPGNRRQNVRIAGISTPPSVRNPSSDEASAFAWSRERLRSMVLSNTVAVAYTFMPNEGGGLGGVYLGSTNVAVPLLLQGAAVVNDASLKCLPVLDQLQLLAAEKEARESGRGFWTNAGVLAKIRQAP